MMRFDDIQYNIDIYGIYIYILCISSNAIRISHSQIHSVYADIESKYDDNMILFHIFLRNTPSEI